jgi:hypothetical protein
MSSEVIQTMRTGGTLHPQEIMNFFMSFLTNGGGVLNKNGDDFKVEAQSVPDMTVKVLLAGALARAVIPNADGGMAYPVMMHADDADLTITANGSGNQRIDAVVLYIDLGATVNTTSSNVAKLTVVAGTPSASPSAPDDTAIGSAIGASNPYIVLAHVAVDSSETEIQNADITDMREQVEFVMREPKVQGAYQDWVTLTPASSVAIDLSKGNKFKITVNQTTTFTVVNAKVGQTFELRVTQDGTGGRAQTFFSTIKWAFGATPTPTTTANKTDKYIFEVVAIGEYDGVIVGQDM